MNEEEKDKQLWKLAKKRVAFHRNLYLFIVINALFWLIWIFDNLNSPKQEFWSFPWPIYPLIGWGIALGLQYFNTYSDANLNAVEREYEKLKREK